MPTDKLTDKRYQKYYRPCYAIDNNLCINLVPFLSYSVFSSKVANFNPPHLHLSPPKGVIPFKFRRELWCQKTRVKGLSCDIICVILRLAVLIQ